MSAVVLLLLVLAGATVAVARRAGRPGEELRGAPVSAWLRATARRTRLWRLAGLTAGTAVGITAMQFDPLGRGPLLAAPLCALLVLAGVVVGELQVTAPRDTVRTAGLAVRRAGEYLPRRLTAAVATATGLLAVVLALTTAAGSPDDLGRAGRALARRCSAFVSEAVGPWPGSFYALPLVAVVVPGLVLAALALRRIVHRPRSADDARLDDALRRQAADSVVAGCGLLVAVPLTGVSFFAAHALSNLDCAPPTWRVLAGALGLLVPAVLALSLWCVVALTAPAPSRAGVAPREPAAL
ncbi:hypothetical protein [Blastococcus sp. PRF04-17]|uniref:hypothetical protein n=1 Tax=Blastococcus sp. PRF04-17 TaxID=2933797 RepID=UPI001FF505B2|nr:hypothetical protein [Blastococcus sp. PRF04-17]UOY01543.1 hypothetical protein MVA48_21870 [Blastococcus sp. PRF04-17]